jgi:putative zinc finger protein
MKDGPTMCDKELLLDYLYGELQPAEREAFDRHLASCAECRSEAEGLRGTREHLALWAPPEPDLGFEIVRSAKPAPVVTPRWRLSPAWGLAAAALLVLSVSAAVANLEVIVGASGVTVHTGWNRTTQQASTTTASSSTQMERLEAKVRDLESQLAARTVTASSTPAALESGSTNRMSDAEILRAVRQQISASEERQKGELALRILQVSRDAESARRADIARVSQGLLQIQGAAAETSHRQRALEDLVVRTGLQR